MERTAMEQLLRWKARKNRKPLIIHGARQVGKTYLIREMLQRNQISYCEYNLVERTDILKFLESAEKTSDISERLAMYSDVPLVEGESVVFLDEIQKYPDIVTKIKFLVDEGKYRYILSGSNLGVELKGIKSIPVGYVDEWQMMPMNFKEFTLASGIKESVWNHVQECFEKRIPVDQIIHDKLIQAFYYYLIVGGMPAVVQVYNESRSMDRIDEEQKSIINQYKADFTRYEDENRKLKVKAVYDNIPAQLNKQNHKFIFTMLDKELKFDRYEESFLWLKDAAVAIPSYIVTEMRRPLQMSKETNVFKLFLSDVGLLTSCYSMAVKLQLLEMNPDNELNNGALFENFVAQEIYSANRSPYYYKKASLGEVDFVIERDDKIIPIEVKSGKSYKKHAALNSLLEKEQLEEAYVLSTYNVEQEGKVIYLPLYMIGLLCEENKIDPKKNKIPKL